MHAALQETVGRWTAGQIHDTVAAIAREPIFRPSRRSLLGRLFEYVFERIGEAIALIRGSPNARLLVIVAMVAVALVIVARVVVGSRGSDAGGSRGDNARAGSAGADAWRASQTLAATGDYTGACHALYAAVLEALAREGAVKRHASKTSGDYARELRLRDALTVRGFRDFAGDFDRVIYGRGLASEDDYTRLASAAERAIRIGAAA
jgi:Domain of unknown function (DUF4129)